MASKLFGLLLEISDSLSKGYIEFPKLWWYYVLYSIDAKLSVQSFWILVTLTMSLGNAVRKLSFDQHLLHMIFIYIRTKELYIDFSFLHGRLKI